MVPENPENREEIYLNAIAEAAAGGGGGGGGEAAKTVEQVANKASTAMRPVILAGSTSPSTQTENVVKTPLLMANPQGDVGAYLDNDDDDPIWELKSEGSKEALTLGNGLAHTTQGSKYGALELYGRDTGKVKLSLDETHSSGDLDITIPAREGILALVEMSPTEYADREREVGTWLNGAPIYQKTFMCGALPALNPGQSTCVLKVDTGLSDIKVVKMYGYAYNATSELTIPLPFISSAVPGPVSLMVGQSDTTGNAEIRIITSDDKTGFLVSAVTIEYYKDDE